MSGGPRKYFTEAALLLVTKDSVLFRPGMLPHLDKAPELTKSILETASIYLVCSRVRVRIDPSTLTRSGDDLTFDLVLDSESGTTRKSSIGQNFFTAIPNVEDVRIHETIPFYVQLLDRHDNDAGSFPVDAFIREDDFAESQLENYEVLYVGQSNPDKSTGNIVSRLANHSTIQRILADYHANVPHREVFIMCFELDEPRTIMSMDPFAKVEIDDDRDIEHMALTVESCPSDAQLTSLAEACFIRFFQPKYNRLLKNSFPSTNLKMLSSCYDLDYNAIVAEIDSEDIFARLYSEAAPPRFHHIVPVDLHSLEDRMSFFQISLDRDGNRTPRWEEQP
ncbi:MAG: hypothetical protein M3457_21745 [Chloroflexota bacterium]|nr:hypothetical protein [Chloroflexota bacterium]